MKRSTKTTSKATKTAALAASNKRALSSRGRALLAHARSLKGKMATTAHALGKTIAKLKDKAMIAALGFENFEALCNVGLGISPDLANQLVAISEHFTAKQAATLGNSKATALIGLARELGGSHTARGLLERTSLDVGDGAPIDVKTASAEKLHHAAQALRAKKPAARTGGVHTTKEDKAFAARLTKALARHGVAGARVTVVAGSSAVGGKMRVEAAIHDAQLVARALTEAARA